MDPLLEKSADTSRGLLFGLLVNCIFSGGISENCPLHDLRSSLSIEEKHKFVLGLTDAEVESILTQHQLCFEKKLSNMKVGRFI
jgi:hypothetical protein